jgi:hypothetical protein
MGAARPSVVLGLLRRPPALEFLDADRQREVVRRLVAAIARSVRRWFFCCMNA